MISLFLELFKYKKILNMDYYKKIDKSFFQYGITIPKKFIDSFTLKL